jgi:hypothetical protein
MVLQVYVTDFHASFQDFRDLDIFCEGVRVSPVSSGQDMFQTQFAPAAGQAGLKEEEI